VLFIIRVKRELKRVYRNGCRYNERLNAETGGSKTPQIHWVAWVNIYRGLDTKHGVFVILRTMRASTPSPFLYWISNLNGIFKIMSFGGLTDLAT
jgi:hypothetical protein